MPHTPRPYQSEAIGNLRANFARGIRRQLLVAPTGAGKTTIAAILIDGAMRKGNTTWFLAHRRELINQCSKRLDDHACDHGVIQSNHPRFKPYLNTQVVSVHTIIRGKRLEAARAHPPSLIIIDEAHRSLAQSYLDVVEAFPDAAVIGLTATPWRLDGKPLGDRYEDLVLVATPQELIDMGYLLAPRVYAPNRPDLTGVKKMGGDYKSDDLAEKMKDAKIVGDVVEHWKKHVAESSNPLTVLFAVNKMHSNVMMERFRLEGIPAAHIDEKTTPKQRDEILGDLSTGKVKVVCNCQILTEGWDLPHLGCVELCRPTQSLALYLQMAGRGMRCSDGKESWLLMDHAGCVLEHGFPQEDREYSLDRPAEKKKRDGTKESGPAVTVCEQCFAIFPSKDRVCPMCNWMRPIDERKIKEDLDAELEELTPEKLKEQKQKKARKLPRERKIEILTQYLKQAHRRGFKIGWAAWRYKELFGRWPHSPWLDDALRELGIKREDFGERRTDQRDDAFDFEQGSGLPGLATERREAPGPEWSVDSIRDPGDGGHQRFGWTYRYPSGDRDEAGGKEAHGQEGDRAPAQLAPND